MPSKHSRRASKPPPLHLSEEKRGQKRPFGAIETDDGPPVARPEYVPLDTDQFSIVTRRRFGVSSSTMGYLWTKYLAGSGLKVQWFMWTVRFLKTGVPKEEMDTLAAGRYRSTTVFGHVFRTLQWLHPRLDEVHFSDRLQPWCAHPGMPKNIRSTIDSFPVEADLRATPKKMIKLLWNKKYGGSIWKITAIFAITGALLAYAIDYGNTGDSPALTALLEKLKEQGFEFENGPPLEFSLADGAYGTANPVDCHLLTPFNVIQLRKGSVEALAYNTWQRFYRSRAEHGVRRLKTLTVLRHITLPPQLVFVACSVALQIVNTEYRRFIPLPEQPPRPVALR